MDITVLSEKTINRQIPELQLSSHINMTRFLEYQSNYGYCGNYGLTIGQQKPISYKGKELEMLQAYLPAQMDESKIREIVKQTIAETGVTSITEMGKVMGALMPKVKGKADGTLVSNIVREALSS